MRLPKLLPLPLVVPAVWHLAQIESYGCSKKAHQIGRIDLGLNALWYDKNAKGLTSELTRTQ